MSVSVTWLLEVKVIDFKYTCVTSFVHCILGPDPFNFVKPSAKRTVSLTSKHVLCWIYEPIQD